MIIVWSESLLHVNNSVEEEEEEKKISVFALLFCPILVNDDEIEDQIDFAFPQIVNRSRRRRGRSGWWRSRECGLGDETMWDVGAEKAWLGPQLGSEPNDSGPSQARVGVPWNQH